MIPNLTLLAVIEGYDVFIPNSYNNPYGFCKTGCPIWVKYNDNDCLVCEITNESNWKVELSKYISDNFPKKREPICRYLSPTDESINKNEKTIFIMNLSGVIFDRAGKIQAKIIALQRELPKEIVDETDGKIDCLPTIEIVVRNCINKSSIKKLLESILHRECAKKHKGQLLWYQAQGSQDYTRDLGFSCSNYGFSFWKIE